MGLTKNSPSFFHPSPSNKLCKLIPSLMHWSISRLELTVHCCPQSWVFLHDSSQVKSQQLTPEPGVRP